METFESAPRLQKRSVMKAMRVMILAAAALSACGPGGEDELFDPAAAQAQQALLPGCDEVNCQEKRAVAGPGGTSVLPQDPVPLHTGLTSPATAGDGTLVPPR